MGKTLFNKKIKGGLVSTLFIEKTVIIKTKTSFGTENSKLPLPRKLTLI